MAVMISTASSAPRCCAESSPSAASTGPIAPSSPSWRLQGPFYNVPELLYFRRDHPTRATRVGSDIRRRCTTLDPKRANRWRHPAARLLGEYLLAYASAIWRAPISPADRMRCSKELAVWIARHANPKYKERLLESPDPAVKDIGVAALSKRPTTRTHSEDAEPVAAGGHHENEGS